MEEMLRALQAQYSGQEPGAPPSPTRERQPPRVESKRDRLRREQEEIRERYRRQQEQPDEG
jgi:hypothetical protein